ADIAGFISGEMKSRGLAPRPEPLRRDSHPPVQLGSSDRRRASTVKAAGPTAPTVTLTFGISFKKAALGRRLTVEAAADDLRGANDFAVGDRKSTRLNSSH